MNKLNKASANLIDYRSIKDLEEKRYYKCINFEVVNTQNGKTVRVELEDNQQESFFVHLPRRFLKVIEESLEHYRNVCKTDKPFYMAYLGLKGRGFQIHFTRNLKNHSI